jgi:hypothetical protein
MIVDSDIANAMKVQVDVYFPAERGGLRLKASSGSDIQRISHRSSLAERK